MTDLVSKAARLHPLAKIGILGGVIGFFWLLLVSPEAQKELRAPAPATSKAGTATIVNIPPPSPSSAPIPAQKATPAAKAPAFTDRVTVNTKPRTNEIEEPVHIEPTPP